MSKLEQQVIQSKLKELKDWTIQEGMLHKIFKFTDFKDAMAFVTRVALIAEPMDHHPDIVIRYNKVHINVLTHSAGGLTEKDFALVKAIES